MKNFANATNLLETIAQQYTNILGKNLVGVYIHGSIAFDCFNWDRSDIDIIVVVNAPLPQQTKQQLLQTLINLADKAPPKGFEMSVVLEKYCKTFVYPTPYELHYGNDCLDDYLKNPLSLCNNEAKTDEDLAAHFTVIKRVGIVLCGAPIAEVFSEVPKESYLDSIRNDIENAKVLITEHPVYITLNLCRVYAYMVDGKVLSKEQGGKWGLENLPSKYHNLIAQVRDNYVSGTALNKDKNDKALQINFAEYMLGLIFNV